MTSTENLRPVPESVRAAFAASDEYFPTPLQKFQFYDKYSRFDYELGRRETWVETVDRAVAFLHELSLGLLDSETYERIRRAILEMRVMPSMRLLAMAGPAARRNNLSLYNCAYLPVDSLEAFTEALIISMAGCGVGFSVERHNVRQLPFVRHQDGHGGGYTVEDSAEGWADALTVGLKAWFGGHDVDFDFSQVRPAGAPLRTKGGRASGPEPLRRLLSFARARILARQGSRLSTLDAHDIMCMIGEVVVSGGVRRCLPAGTRVHTRRGAVPIELVKTGDEVMTDKGYKQVTGWMDQGTQSLVEIETESGTTFRCTPNHRIAVLTNVRGDYSFKQAKDLGGEDRIIFITHPIEGTETGFLPLPEKRASDHSGSVIKQPILDTEGAWFLGKFFANGYVSTPALTAAGKKGNTNFDVATHANKDAITTRLTDWMRNHGLRPRVERPVEERTAKVRSSNRQIARWMAQYKQAKTCLVIPDEIWFGKQEVRAAFIAGVMDGDGSVCSRPTVIVDTSYPQFGRDVVRLLATLGIIAEFKQLRAADHEKGWRAMYRVSVKDFLALERCVALIGPFACHKFIPRKGKQAGYTVPALMMQRDIPYAQRKTFWTPTRGTGANSSTVAQVTGSTHFVPVKVREVRSVLEQEATYDIEVADGGVFVAEGYLVHNSAMLSLFDHGDDAMRSCKNGDLRGNEQRWNANNSAVWPERKLSQVEVADFFLEMAKGGRGEPGIFNRQAVRNTRPARRQDAEFGVNPCGEIGLRPMGLCNLSIAVARPDDTFESLREKVELATIIGTIQSMATHFPGLRDEWRKNAEEERLLGVDITGQMDSEVAREPWAQRRLLHKAQHVNRGYADLLGINPSTAITCVKPSGNSSQLLNCSPGLHTRWSPYYIRNVRVGAHGPMFKTLLDAGVPMDPENGQDRRDADTWVAHFPMKAPDGALTRADFSAVEQCDYWLRVKTNWTEHTASVTITYQPDEIIPLMQWIWTHQDVIGGMAFLPASDAKYDQMPYEEISREEYERLAAQFPQIDFAQMYRYEEEDLTTAAQELACMSGSCDIF